MTKRTDIGGKIVCQGKARGAKNSKHNLSDPPSHNNQGGSPSRLSPGKVSPPRSPVIEPSPRSSPGLVAGYYAGCKFTEPPSASALPLPPQHWTQTHKSVMFPFRAIKIPSPVDQHHDFTQQLKLLLKVQAWSGGSLLVTSIDKKYKKTFIFIYYIYFYEWIHWEDVINIRYMLVASEHDSIWENN